MAKIIKDIIVSWTWDGDLESISGFNIAICYPGQTPISSSTAFVTVTDPTQRNYIFKNLTLTTLVQYQAFVQALYPGGDSDWIQTGSSVYVPDDGLNTLSKKQATDLAATTAIWGPTIIGTPTPLTTLTNTTQIDNSILIPAINAASQAVSGAIDAANAASAMLSDLASDNVLSVTEKKLTLKEWITIQSDKTALDLLGSTFNLTTLTGNLDLAYSNLNTYLTPLLLNPTASSTIDGGIFRSQFKSYYDAKIALLSGVSNSAATTSTWAGVTGSGKAADNATKNTIWAQISSIAPTAAQAGDTWYKTDLNTTFTYDGTNWTYSGNGYTNTSQLTDGANLGLTATVDANGNLVGSGGVTVSNTKIQIIAGVLQGIGTGNNTAVANTNINVDINGVLTGTGATGIVVANNKIAVNDLQVSAFPVSAGGVSGVLQTVSGTTQYRNDTYPSNNATFGTLNNGTATSDGNVVVVIPYNYTQGTVLADSIYIFLKEGGGTVLASDPAWSTNAVSGTIQFTLKPNTVYTFGLQAVRRTESGLVGTSILTSSSIITVQSNYTALIGGTPASGIVTSAANGASAWSKFSGVGNTMPAGNVEFNFATSTTKGGSATNTDYVGSTAASAVQQTTLNFNQRNDRNSTAIVAPIIIPNGTTLNHTINTDSSSDISFTWWWGGNNNDIDGWIVYSYSSTSSSQYIFGTDTPNEKVSYLTPDRRAFIINGVPSNKYYTFSVKAYRIVDPDINSAGVIYSTLVRPLLGYEDPYQPSSTVQFNGDITGTIQGVGSAAVISNASNGQTAYQGTANIRNDIPPTNPPNITSVNGVATSDGNVVATIGYTYTQGTLKADQLLIYAKAGGGTVTTSDVCWATNPATGTFNIICLPNTAYSFSMQAIRVTDGGVQGTYLLPQANMTAIAGNYTNLIGSVTASGLVNQSQSNYNEILNISSDSIISKGEKPQLILDYQTILNDQSGLQIQATNLGLASSVEVSGYNTSITNLTTYLTSLTPAYNDTTQNTTMSDNSTMSAKFKDVYLRKQNLQNRIYTATSLSATIDPTTGKLYKPDGTLGTVVDNSKVTLSGLGYTGASNATANTSYVGSTDPSGSNTLYNGDIWYNPTTGSLQIRSAGIWTPAADNTQTTINQGVVTTGIFQVGSGTSGSSGNINAGISGNGTTASDVRFWAGSSFANRNTAPFYVTQDGSLVATKATISGNITMGAGSSINWSTVGIPPVSSGNICKNGDFLTQVNHAGLPDYFYQYNNSAISTTCTIGSGGALSNSNYFRLVPNIPVPVTPGGTWGFYFNPSGNPDAFGNYKAKTDYTVSFYARATGANTTGLTFRAGNNTPPQTSSWIQNLPLTSSWQRYIFTFNWGTVTPMDARYPYFTLAHDSVVIQAGETLDFSCVQVETGIVATTWNPLNPYLTNITSSGIYTGTLTADNIIAGLSGGKTGYDTAKIYIEDNSSISCLMAYQGGNGRGLYIINNAGVAIDAASLTNIGISVSSNNRNAILAISNGGAHAISGSSNSSSSYAGVSGVNIIANGIGVTGSATLGTTGVGILGYGSGYDFYAGWSNKLKGTTVSSFTGAHEGLIEKNDFIPEGDILVDKELINNRDISQNIFIHKVSDSVKQINVIGIITSERILLSDEIPISLIDKLKPKINKGTELDPVLEWDTIDGYDKIMNKYDLIYVNALGDGSINVCKDGGNISAGDYICSSSRPGKGMKQDDDLMHNYTVAKAREDCIWLDTEDDIRLLACTYHCG